MINKISIIIPVLNEVEFIGQLVKHLLENSDSENISEIIVVDGGSTDGTLEVLNETTYVTSSAVERPQKGLDCARPDKSLSIAQRDPVSSSGLANQSKILLINSPKGRAKQMNIGAKHAKGNILYFLHADSFPPKNFDQLIIAQVQKENKAGCFRLQFDSKHWWLRLASWFTQFSWRACRGGDQSQFITRTLFDEIDGYDESYIIYEDNILINELYARNQYAVINEKIKTSARLYNKHGIWKLQYHFWTIYVKKWFGASSDDLLAYYKKNIH